MVERGEGEVLAEMTEASHREWLVGEADSEDQPHSVGTRSLGPMNWDLVRHEAGDYRATKYLDWGWWQMRALVVCSGWYW